MKDLPKVFDMPVLVEGRLGDKVNELQNFWAAAEQSPCSQAGAWQGEIDDPIRRLLSKLAEFFSWKSQSAPAMRARAEALFVRLDPSGLNLPQPLAKQRTSRWMTLHDYFNGATHRSRTTEAEFSTKLDELEQLLIASLNPTPSEDFSAIDAILAEASGNA